MALINEPTDRIGISDYPSRGEEASSAASAAVVSPLPNPTLGDTSADSVTIVAADAADPDTSRRFASQQLAWQRLCLLLLAPKDSPDADSGFASDTEACQLSTAGDAERDRPDCIEPSIEDCQDGLLTVEESANYLGVSLTEMYRLLVDGSDDIWVVKVGTSTWILQETLDVYLDWLDGLYEVDCDAE